MTDYNRCVSEQKYRRLPAEPPRSLTPEVSE